MKKVLSIAIGMAMTVSFAYAQVTPDGSVAVTTTVTNIISLTATIPVAAIAMTDADHYENGTSTAITGALTVTSNQIWDLSVKVDGDATFGANTIPAADFGVTISGEPGGTNTPVTDLSTTDQTLLNEVPATAVTALNVTYAADGGSNFLGVPTGAYLSTYTFTVTVD